MFTSLELRKAANGWLITVNNDDDAQEYVFDHLRKAIKFIKEISDAKPTTKKQTATAE